MWEIKSSTHLRIIYAVLIYLSTAGEINHFNRYIIIIFIDIVEFKARLIMGKNDIWNCAIALKVQYSFSHSRLQRADLNELNDKNCSQLSCYNLIGCLFRQFRNSSPQYFMWNIFYSYYESSLPRPRTEKQVRTVMLKYFSQWIYHHCDGAINHIFTTRQKVH